MNKRITVIAPHPDDETLGAGGTLLKHKAEGDIINWIIITQMSLEQGFDASQIANQENEIFRVSQSYDFDNVIKLGLPAANLDTIPVQVLVQELGGAVCKQNPQILYVPYPGDVHSDHACAFNAISGCSKWFRFGGIKQIMAYETLSETEFGINAGIYPFRPNIFVQTSAYLETKISIMKNYAKEMGPFPFPRSEEAIRSLARYRGSTAGFEAAEAFMLLKGIID